MVVLLSLSVGARSGVKNLRAVLRDESALR